ncbi:MAG TPA: hypothetical protein VIB07_05660 [Nitrososphaera sp.]
MKELLVDYLLALPELTMSDQGRFKHQVTELQAEIRNANQSLRNSQELRAELERKERHIHEEIEEAVEKKIGEMMALIRQNPLLANVKAEELARLKPSRIQTQENITHENKKHR